MKESSVVKWVGNYKNHNLDIKVKVLKLIDESFVKKAANKTSHSKISKMNLKDFYKSEHSPIRTQMFWVDIDGIPSFVHTHFVRHTVWNQPFVRTGREDRGMKKKQDRWTPNDMALFLNAQTLINLSRKRLCNKSHFVTKKVMRMVKKAIAEVDPDLSPFLVKECIYRGGKCYEFKSCGFRNY